MCGTASEDGYMYSQSGLFGWVDWDNFLADCADATDNCDLDLAGSYDGWALGFHVYNYDATVNFADSAKFGVCFADDTLCWFMAMVNTATPQLSFYWSLNETTEFSESYPAVTDLTTGDFAAATDFTYGFNHWFNKYYIEDDYQNEMIDQTFFKWQATESDDKFELTDEYELWTVSSIDETNVQSLVVLGGASAITAAAATAALVASLA